MTMDKLGRGFGALSLEEQVQALRDHALGQDLLIRALLVAVSRLGVSFTTDSEPLNLADDEPVPGR